MTDAPPFLAGPPSGWTAAHPSPAALAPTSIRIDPAPPETLLMVELWAEDRVRQALAQAMGPLPPPCRAGGAGPWRTLWWEPSTWLVRSPAEEREVLSALLARATEGNGAVTDVSGGQRRVRVSGPRWRDLMMIGAVFDAEDPSFGPGCVIGTVMHHLPVRLDVVATDTVDAYIPPSYADELLHHWTAAQRRFSLA